MEAPQGGVMTIDAAGITGWAYGPTSWVMPWFGDWVLPFEGGEGCKFAAFENELIDACEQFLPEKIVLEAPINMPAMTNRAAMWQQLGLRALVRSNAWRRRIAVTEVSADIVRGELLGFCRVPGKPDAIKKHVVNFCRKRGWKVPSHNAGDACMLWEWHRRRVTGGQPAQMSLGEVA